MKHPHLFLLPVAVTAILYFVAAFTLFEPNPANWRTIDRGIISFLIAASCIVPLVVSSVR